MAIITSAAEVRASMQTKKEKDFNQYIAQVNNKILDAAEKGNASMRETIVRPESWKESEAATFAILCAKMFAENGYNVIVHRLLATRYCMDIRW